MAKKLSDNQWNVRVPKEFRGWGDERIEAKGLDKALCTAAAVYYIIALPGSDRERIISNYRDFLQKGCPIDNDGLSPLEAAFEKANKIIPVGSLLSQKKTGQK